MKSILTIAALICVSIGANASSAAEGASVKLVSLDYSKPVSISTGTPLNSFTVYCSDPAMIDVIRNVDQEMNGKIDQFKKYLTNNSTKSVKTALFGYSLTYQQIADTLVLVHRYYTYEGGAVGISYGIAFSNGYMWSVLNDLYPEAKIDASKMEAKVMLTGACAVSEIGGAP